MYPGATARAVIRIRIRPRVIRIPTLRAAIRSIVPIAAGQQPPKALAPFFARTHYAIRLRAQPREP